MAKATRNPIITGISGQVGNLLFRQVGNETIIGLSPDLSRVAATPAQLAHRRRFQEAAQYGKMAMADPEKHALYQAEARQRHQPIFSVIVGDFFKPPTVTHVDAAAYTGQAGQVIVVQAQDDVLVTAVALTLTDGAGVVLETGAAQANPPNSGRWTYVTTAAANGAAVVRIVAAATDMPGHVGQAEVEVELG